jgi:hypothetical protein
MNYFIGLFVNHSVTVYLCGEDNGQVEMESKKSKGFLKIIPVTKQGVLAFCFYYGRITLRKRRSKPLQCELSFDCHLPRH